MSTKAMIPLALMSMLAFADLAHAADTGNKQDIPELKMPQLTPKQVIDARRHFQVEVLSFDTSKRYGSKFPYSDYVKLRITNNSDVTLPYITPLIKRYSSGNAIGWSRAPVIAVHDLAPTQSKTIDYYPHGHLSVVPVDKLTVEIEPTIDEEDMRLFKELAP